MGVKIHLLKRVAGPDGNWGAGETIEVDQAQADGLVAAGAAERIDAMQPYVTEAEVNTPPAPPQAGGTKKETATEKPSGKKEKATEV